MGTAKQGKEPADALGRHLHRQLSLAESHADAARADLVSRTRAFAAERAALQAQARQAERSLTSLQRQYVGDPRMLQERNASLIARMEAAEAWLQLRSARGSVRQPRGWRRWRS